MSSTNQEEIEEVEILQLIIRKMSELELEAPEAIYDRIHENQPFILSVIIGYEENFEKGLIDKAQYFVIRDMFIMIYLFFDEKTNIKRSKITNEVFLKQFQVNIDFLESVAKEPNRELQLDLQDSNINKIHFNNLYFAVTSIAEVNNDFKILDHNTKATLFLEVKTLIECMEASLLEQ